MLQSKRRLPDPLTGQRNRQRPMPLHEALEGLALDKLHCQVVQVACLVRFIDEDDVGMREARRGLGLAAETEHRFRMRQPFLTDDLERDGPAGRGLSGFVYDAHAATA